MSRLLDYVEATPWALEAGVYARLVQVIQRHAAGGAVADSELAEITAAREARAERQMPSGYVRQNGVGVVPISGVLARHARQVNGSSQPRGTSLEQVRSDFGAALADPQAHSIMLAIDSPGGSVDGLAELADEIRNARGAKPIVAHVAGTGASAAYWLAAQADEVYATRSSRVGSIGVIAAVVDNHRNLEQQGLDVKVITSAPAKAAGAPGKTLSIEDLATLKSEVGAWHELFVEAVAAGRGLDIEAAAALGDGRVHFAPAAQALGLIDGIATEAGVMATLGQRSEASATTAQENDMAGKQDAGTAPAAAEKPQAAPVASALPATPATPAIPVIDAEAIARDARTQERARIASIQALGEGVAAPVIAQAIADGVSPEQAAVRFVGWHQEHRRAALTSMREDMNAATRAVGTSDPDVRVESKPVVEATGPDKWRKDFEASADLRAEFATVDRYLAYMTYDGRPARKES